MKRNRKIRKICLVQPSARLTWNTNKYVWPPLGLLYLASSLQNRGYDVEIIDAIMKGFDGITYLDDTTYLLGLEPGDLAQRVVSTHPDLVGVCFQFENQGSCIDALCNKIKKMLPDCFILLGGPTATLCAESLIKKSYTDGIVLGDSDKRLPDYIDWLNNGDTPLKIDGSGFRRNDGEFLVTPLSYAPFDLDDVPFPARDLIDLEDYFSKILEFKRQPKNQRAVTMITSRGCPGQCCFCANPILHGRRHSYRSPEKVVEEIRMLIDRYSAQEIIFFDENWSAHRKRTEKLLTLMCENEFGINWYPNDTALWTMTDSILEKMARSGCYKVKFSVESGSPRVLKEIIRKPVDLNAANVVVRKAQNLGMAVGVNFVIGFPGETRDEILQTFRYALEIDADFTVFNIATPYNKTPLTEMAIEQGLLPPDFVYDSLAPGVSYWDLPDVAGEELERWRQEFWLECNFRTPEKEKRFNRFALTNPDFKPVTKPDQSPMRTNLLV